MQQDLDFSVDWAELPPTCTNAYTWPSALTYQKKILEC